VQGEGAESLNHPPPLSIQHEAILAQEKMANAPNHTTVCIPVGANGMPLVYGPE
jgi:hypothetical protein